MTKVLTAGFSGLFVEHPRLGLEAGRPGSLHQRGQVWPPRPVLPRLRILHHGQQHDDHQPAWNHSGDAALEERLPFNLQQSCPRRDSLSNFCRVLFSGATKTAASAKFTCSGGCWDLLPEIKLVTCRCWGSKIRGWGNQYKSQWEENHSQRHRVVHLGLKWQGEAGLVLLQVGCRGKKNHSDCDTGSATRT